METIFFLGRDLAKSTANLNNIQLSLVAKKDRIWEVSNFDVFISVDEATLRRKPFVYNLFLFVGKLQEAD